MRTPDPLIDEIAKDTAGDCPEACLDWKIANEILLDKLKEYVRGYDAAILDAKAAWRTAGYLRRLIEGEPMSIKRKRWTHDEVEAHAKALFPNFDPVKLAKFVKAIMGILMVLLPLLMSMKPGDKRAKKFGEHVLGLGDHADHDAIGR